MLECVAVQPVARFASTDADSYVVVVPASESPLFEYLERRFKGDPAVSVVGPLPQDLHAWLDGDVAISARTADAKAAAEFLAYITRPAAAPVWKAKGLDRP